MDLKTYFKKVRETETITAWCERHNLNPISVSLVANGHRQAGPELAKQLSAASGGLVPLAVIRPDLWG